MSCTAEAACYNYVLLWGLEHAEKWTYDWNVRDQMTSASVVPEQTGTQGYEASQWIPAFAGMTMERRYEYDGLNLLRVDQLYDANGNGLTEDDAWRRLEAIESCEGSV